MVSFPPEVDCVLSAHWSFVGHWSCPQLVYGKTAFDPWVFDCSNVLCVGHRTSADNTRKHHRKSFSLGIGAVLFHSRRHDDLVSLLPNTTELKSLRV